MAEKVRSKVKIKRGDKVRIIAGKDKGKEGKVLHVNQKTNRLIVEGANMITKHVKPGKSNQTGGIVNKEAPLSVSNVMYLHNGTPVRIGYDVDSIVIDGKKQIIKKRIARPSGEVID